MKIDISALLFNLVGGLGIFLYGMRLMSEGLQKVAGDQLRTIFNMVTTNRFIGVFTGFLITAIIQSSSATTVMLVGFVNAGIMSLQQAIHVILGANIGTTFTGWIIAFKITKYGLPIIGLGAGLLLFSKSEKVNYIGEVVLGLGMLFFGLTLMKAGFKPLRHDPTFHNFFLLFGADNILKISMSVLAGCVLTLIVQSSSATLGITMGLASQGLLTFPAAAALVLGENIGTTITALLSSIGTDTNARRTALSHSLFNAIGVILIIIIFPYYIQLVEWVIPGIADFAQADGSKPNIMPHIAASHTIFNIANMLVFLPFVTLLSRIVSVIIKEKPLEEKEERLVHLHYDSYGIPSLMIDEARREIEKMIDIATLMFISNREFLFQSDKNHGHLLKETNSFEHKVDGMQEEIVKFLAMVSGHRALTVKDVEDIHIYTRIVDETESVADYCNRLIKLIHRKIENNIGFSEEAMMDLETIFGEMFDFITLAKMVFSLRDDRMVEDCHKKSKELNILIEEANKEHIDRLHKGICEAIPAVYFTKFLGHLRRLRSHTINIVEAAMGEK
jgi:phosphate:Na+ symporter